MDQEDRLPAIVEYLKMHPTPSAVHGGEGGGQVIHVHEHHHYAPPAPPPPPPKPTVAEQVIPWLYVGLMATIIATVCAMILAAVMVILVLGLMAVTLFAAVLAYLIKTTRESQINTGLVEKIPRPVQRRRR